MPPSDIVHVQHLGKAFGARRVLDDVSVSIHGGIVALLGPNGAGKTTLINILSTLLRPDRGTARVCGWDVVTDRRQVRACIAVTGQYAAVDDQLTGSENLVMMGRLFGLPAPLARRRADDLLAAFDLTSGRRQPVPHHSDGLRRSLDLAICLIRRQRVIFLDEPTTGLDTPSRQALWEQVRTIGRTGDTAILLTTQYLPEAEELADRVLVLDSGSIVADGTVGQLKAAVGADMIEIRDARGRIIRTVPTDGTAEAVTAVLGRLPTTTRVTVRAPSLDEVFLQLTGTGRLAELTGHDHQERTPA